MPQGQNNPPPAMKGLFTQANYRFSSQAANRPPTFYFADAAGNRGRFRQNHAQGPELVHQGLCSRVFISPELRLKVDSGAELVVDAQQHDDVDFAWNTLRYETFERICQLVARGNPDGIYVNHVSANTQAGWHLFDTNGRNVHFSAGLVVVNCPLANAFFANGGNIALAQYDGPWKTW